MNSLHEAAREPIPRRGGKGDRDEEGARSPSHGCDVGERGSDRLPAEKVRGRVGQVEVDPFDHEVDRDEEAAGPEPDDRAVVPDADVSRAPARAGASLSDQINQLALSQQFAFSAG